MGLRKIIEVYDQFFENFKGIEGYEAARGINTSVILGEANSTYLIEISCLPCLL